MIVGNISYIDMLYVSDYGIRCLITFSNEVNLTITVDELIKRIHKFHSYYIDGGIILKIDVLKEEDFILELIKKLKMINLNIIIKGIKNNDYSKYYNLVDKIIIE